MRPLLLAALALLLASAPDAQVRQGMIEVGGSGFVTFTDGGFLSLTPVVGYFLTDRLEVGLNPRFATDFDDGSAFLTAFGALHVPSTPDSRSVPYVGASVGSSLTDGGGVALGAEGGVKLFFLPGGAVTVNAFANTDDSFDAVTAGVQGGVSIFIGG